MKKLILEIFLFLVFCFGLYSFIFMNTQSTTDQRTAFACFTLIPFFIYIVIRKNSDEEIEKDANKKLLTHAETIKKLVIKNNENDNLFIRIDKSFKDSLNTIGSVIEKVETIEKEINFLQEQIKPIQKTCPTCLYKNTTYQNDSPCLNCVGYSKFTQTK